MRATSHTALMDSRPDRNYYSDLIPNQRFAQISTLQLESGQQISPCTIAYKSWGRLNSNRDNVLVVCHALTGSSDVGDWWSPLLGPGKALDYTRFFIFCANCLGSPYGSESPLTIDPTTGKAHGAEFPATTIRDDVRLVNTVSIPFSAACTSSDQLATNRSQKLVLDALGISSVAAVIGGSMGGMTTLEWPLCTPPGYVRNIIPIATSLQHGAWGIAWAETQRRCIQSDPMYNEGQYEARPDGQPTAGLASARMIAMLTYRSSTSFGARFGRRPNSHVPKKGAAQKNGISNGDIKLNGTVAHANPEFSAQGYLHHQGAKFVRRFDANCYLHILDKIDNHDVFRNRSAASTSVDIHSEEVLCTILSHEPEGALVVGVESDVLYPLEEQARIAAALPGATLSVLSSSDGHDGFLLEFAELNRLILEHLHTRIPDSYEGAPICGENEFESEYSANGVSMVGAMEE